MKKFVAIISTILLAFALFCGGCMGGKNGVDGKDGQDVSIYEIYEKTNAARVESGLEELTFLDFVTEYLKYDESELSQLTSLQATINRSLFSGVSIIANSTYEAYVQTGGFFSNVTIEKITYNKPSSGSGVIIDVDKTTGDAYVVTNYHVVYDSQAAGDGYCTDLNLFLYGKDKQGTHYTMNKQKVGTDGDGKPFNKIVVEADEFGIKAEVVGASVTYDLALLKVTGSEIIKNSTVYAAEFTDSDIVDCGQTVYAVGNPNGWGMSVTGGIVSVDSEEVLLSLDDSISTAYYRVLRTDTPISPGNSGGGLFDINGKILGVVNSKSVAEKTENIGYAIPASTARRVIASMRYYEGQNLPLGSIKQADFGFTVKCGGVKSYIDNATGLAKIEETLQVETVNINSLVYGSGQNTLTVGDVILKMKVTSADGAVVREEADMTRAYLLEDLSISVRAGDKVTFTALRSGNTEPEEVTVTVPYDNIITVPYDNIIEV